MSELQHSYDFDAIPEGFRSGFVAVAGRPNVGKSTLINRLLRQKVSIVSPKPQTTRRRLLGILSLKQAQLILVDTPGLHDPRNTLGEAMVSEATNAIHDADVVLFMVDISAAPTEEDRALARTIRQQTPAPVILVLNKVDRLPEDQIPAQIDAYGALMPDAYARITTAIPQGTHVDQLLETIIDALPEGPPYYPAEQITDQPEREIAAEMIREQVLHFTHHEVPHAVAVVVQEFKERENGMIYISAHIFVEKSSQKGIVIGKKGRMLRKIGSVARQEIERMLGSKVYLDLWVKVRKNWRKKKKELQRLGYDVSRL